MAFPIWITPAGDLGVIPELEYYEKVLDSYSATGGTITYSHISGILPTGLQIASSGKIQGIPVAPREGDQNTEYRFSVRATHSTGGVADRSFTITVTNIAPPTIFPKSGSKVLNITGNAITATAGTYITQAASGANAYVTSDVTNSVRIPISYVGTLNFITGRGNLRVGGTAVSSYPVSIESSNYYLGEFLDGTVVDYQLQTVEFLPGKQVAWSLIGGELPPGLTLTTDGLITGYTRIQTVNSPSGTPEWGINPWDYLGWDFPARAIDKNYTFTVQTYDGVNYDIVTYRMLVRAKTGITADSTLISADTVVLYYDSNGNPVSLLVSTGAKHDPILITGTRTLPPQTQGTYLAYQFQAVGNVANGKTYDLDGDEVNFAIPSTVASGYDYLANASPSTIYVSQTPVAGFFTVSSDSEEGLGDDLVPGVTVKFPNAGDAWTEGTINANVIVGFTGGNLLATVSIGDFITQPASGANATVSNVTVGFANDVLGLVYNTSTPFLLDNLSGNIVINGGTPTIFYPIDVRAIGVTDSGTLTPEGTGFDEDLFDQGSQGILTGFTIDAETGWLYGNLPATTDSVSTYQFQVYAYKKDYPNYQSGIKTFSITVLADFITWSTPSRLGTLQNGELCDLRVVADDPQNRRLFYSLDAVSSSKNNPGYGAAGTAVLDPVTGEVLDITIDAQGQGYTYAPVITILSSTGVNAQAIATVLEGKITNITVVSPGIGYTDGDTEIRFDGIGNRLPQGLRLYNDGTIQGRVSFQLFKLDNDVISFDGGTTTFDREYVFTVMAADQTGSIDTMKTFIISLVNRNDAPYENVYLKALPSRAERETFTALIQNPVLFPPELIYRKDDPSFGVADEIKFLFLPGVQANSLAEYMNAVDTNHFRKRLLFGEIKTAVAVDDEFNDQYEVVYVEILDSATNADGDTAPNVIDLSRLITNPYLYGSGSYNVAYPNAFENMSSELVNTLGYENKGALPKWMTSNQPNPNNPDQFLGPLGFTRAVVLAYTVPGAADKIAYRLRNYGFNLNSVEFDIDRYQVDNILSQYYDSTTSTWDKAAEVTFDRYPLLPSHFVDKGVVNYAVDIPFERLYNKSKDYIIANGGIDGIVDFQTGDKVIFKTQQFTVQYDAGDLADYNYGWNKVLETWEQYGWDQVSPSVHQSWDPATTVPGYNEHNLNSSVRDERISIWTINIDSNNLVTLTSTTEIAFYDKVYVRNGSNYGGTNMYYNPTVATNKVIPEWTVIPQQISTTYTTFDGNGTRFFDNKDIYAAPGSGDKYISFPRIGVFT